MQFLDERLPKAFWDRCIPEPNSGCWLWFGAANREGYGRFHVGRRLLLAHRVAYEALVAAIPDGMHMDHRCRTPHCCNPAHVEPVTPLANWERGLAPSRLAIQRNACKYGHPYDESNGHVRVRDGKTSRVCRRCRHISKRKAEQKRKAA